MMAAKRNQLLGRNARYLERGVAKADFVLPNFQRKFRYPKTRNSRKHGNTNIHLFN